MTTVMVSGLQCPHCATRCVVEWPIAENLQVVTADEGMLLDGYRMVRQQQGGTLFFEMRNGAVQRWDVSPNFGTAQAINRILKAGGGGGGTCEPKEPGTS